MERFRALLPAKVRDRAVTYVALAVMWPFVPESAAVGILRLMNHLSPGMLTQPQFLMVYIPTALASGIGAAILLVALPIRYLARIAVSVAGGLLVLFTSGVWFAFIELVLGEAGF